jgi:hypothetical protein
MVHTRRTVIERSMEGAQHWEMTSSRRRNPGQSRSKPPLRLQLNSAPPARPMRPERRTPRTGGTSPPGAPITVRSTCRRRRRRWPPISARSPARAPRCQRCGGAAPRSATCTGGPDHDNPAAHAGVKATLAGIARTLGSAPAKKTALTADLLAKALRRIPEDLAGLRDRALILIGFAAALRRSELVALDVADIAHHPKGLVITIRRSKTDQAGAGFTKAVPHGRKLGAVRALDAWLAAAGIGAGPVFRGVRGTRVLGRRLCAHQVARIVQKRRHTKVGQGAVFDPLLTLQAPIDVLREPAGFAARRMSWPALRSRNANAPHRHSHGESR